MKARYFMAALTALAVAGAGAQTMNVQVGNVTYAIPAETAGEMVYSDGLSLTVLGRTFSVDEIDRIYVDDSEVADNTVTVVYDNSSAGVTIAGNIAQYVTADVSGAHVTVTQSDLVGDETCGEITYILSGSSGDGSFELDGSFKATIELQGLALTNPSGAPLNIQDGKRIELSVKKGTENVLTDGAGGSQKGCIACKGHLELKGKGSLTVNGNTAHGFYAKEYIEMKNCTVNVTSAVKDGINCNQYFLMESGELNISGVGDDGIQVSFKDDTDREAEDTGSFTMSGGSINVAATATASKAIKADGDISISGGSITASVSGGGKWDEDDAKTKAASCLSCDGNMVISAGTLQLTATGGGGKGINCDGSLTIDGGDITVSTSGGMYAYVNGTEYPNYTGNTDRLTSDQKSSPKGMKVDGDVTINGGSINVTTTGNGGEGIESKSEMTVNAGTIVVNSRNDGLNSSSHMYIKGGDITVVATGNDALDSNGNMYISGGTIRAFGASAPECGLDANEEENYSVYFTGGTVLAVGGGNSVPSSSESTQAYVTGSGSVTAGSTVSLKSGDTVLAEFTVPDNYTASGGGRYEPGGGGPGGWGGGGSSILITCAGLTSGSSYTLVNGSSSSSVTARLTGGGSGRP